MSSTTSEKSAQQGSPVQTPTAKQDSGVREEVQTISGSDSDEAELARMGYKQEFVREFTNLSVRYDLLSCWAVEAAEQLVNQR